VDKSVDIAVETLWFWCGEPVHAPWMKRIGPVHNRTGSSGPPVHGERVSVDTLWGVWTRL